MILASAIPSDPKTFIAHCLRDVHAGWFAKPADKYLDYLAEETEHQHPAMYRYVKVIDRESGAPRFSADADHIIPRSVWNLLMPDALKGRPEERYPTFSGVLSNLFWRDKEFNRRDDNLSIKLIREVQNASMSRKEQAEWLKKWITLFLLTKRDEGVLCTADVVDPHKLDELTGPSERTNWMAYAAKPR